MAALPPHSFIELLPGTYTLAAQLAVGGTRRIVGATGDRPRITKTGTGPVIEISSGANLSFEHIEVFGAVTNGNDYGDGIDCNPTPIGTRVIKLDDVLLDNNQHAGLDARSCIITATRSTFANNAGFGYFANESTSTIDRCIATINGAAFQLDSGNFTLTNTFITRNTDALGLSVDPGQVGARASFNTIVDNGRAFSEIPLTSIEVANNIIARNADQTCSGCNIVGAIILTDVTSLHFASPDVAPFDYHITAGSIAIDAANPSFSVTNDVDGDARPRGAAMDVGADETK